LLSIVPKPSQKVLARYYPSQSYYSYQKDNNGFFVRLRKYLIYCFYNPTVVSKFLFFFINTVPAIPWKRKNGKLLDIGCGSGQTISILKNLGWNVYGIDVDGHAIAAARAAGLSVKQGTYEKLSTYPDGFFDVIRMYHVIEHLDDPVRCIHVCQKKLKKGGELIIGTPNAESWVSKLFRGYWYNLDSPRHLYVFSPNTLGTIINNEQFMVHDISFCSGGGIAGSVQYILSDIWKKRITLVDNVFAFFLFYPIEWLFDRMRRGDVFVLTARKT